MSYIRVCFHLAFLLFAGVSALTREKNPNGNELKLKFAFNETMIRDSAKFFVHTRYFPEGIEFNAKEESPFIRANTSTKILIHGYFHSENEIQQIVEEYLNAPEDCNVITFSWKVIYDLNYLAATRAAKYIGNFILPKAIARMGCLYTLQPFQIHLIGYHLGAHLAGITAANLGLTIGRITGLDPSRNCFEVPCQGVIFPGLSINDAEFVDVLHTSAHIEGFSRPVGTIDLYANGGTFQPACDQEFELNCNSMMALKYFAESIKSNSSFYGLQCPSHTKFLHRECKGHKRISWSGARGIDTDTPLGTFYFVTKAVPPYGQGLDGTEPK